MHQSAEMLTSAHGRNVERGFVKIDGHKRPHMKRDAKTMAAVGDANVARGTAMDMACHTQSSRRPQVGFDIAGPFEDSEGVAKEK